ARVPSSRRRPAPRPSSAARPASRPAPPRRPSHSLSACSRFPPSLGVMSGRRRSSCHAPSGVALAVGLVEHRQQVHAVRDGLPQGLAEPGEVHVVLAELIPPPVQELFELARLLEQLRLGAALLMP